MKKFVAIGHVDTGKSTLCGHLLYKCGFIDERSMEKIKIKAKEDGMESWIYARVLDIYEEEMERGKTHEFDTIIFNFNNKVYQLIDTPGHQKFVRSMIEGISNDDVNIAILLLSMKENEFESSFDGGGMTKEHLILARAIGIEHLVLIANKMDVIEWDEKLCKDKIIHVTKYLVKNLGWPKENLHVVPISAFEGIGLTDVNGLPPWYKGKCLMDTIDSIPNKIKDDDSKNVINNTNRFICELSNIGMNTIITVGFTCIMHFNGLETEIEIEKIQSKKIIRSGEKGVCIIKMINKENCYPNMKIIIRKNNGTIGFGKITKIK